ncbi:hypothetical protein IEN85_18650 [Pelagicoccus sp. NFK12]|uniref:Lipoprotein n=1 Tax=Pelagicoccus enzymogenes TaxID=2773457 RepID=A0A927IJ84_9BACT|nr:hypothetical protein [Pelagicoccus enzymogenes]MBD5781528.1 hypothetical protein [Pelagicoccus enzymogenes]
MKRYISVIQALLIIALTSCGDVTCDEDSEAVASARALTPERLERLYAQMAELVEKVKKEEVYIEYSVYDDGIPEEFEDIGAISIEPVRGIPSIRLDGCFDHHIDLLFVGIGIIEPSSSEKQILLIWGEHSTAGEEVLWKENIGANQAELTTPDAARPTS